VCLSEAPSPPGFCLWWSSNFVGSEFGQVQRVTLLQNMVSNPTAVLKGGELNQRDCERGWIDINSEKLLGAKFLYSVEVNFALVSI
jgi:hypothetical protein